MFNLQKIKRAIPEYWKNCIQDDLMAIVPHKDPRLLDIGNKTNIHISKLTSKQIYKILLKL